MEKALNVFDEMKAKGCEPNHVTYNSLIAACVKRREFYDAAFDLLREMLEKSLKVDGYTFNLLMFGAAKSRDFRMARKLLRQVLKSKELVQLDEVTFTNAFFAYASAQLPKKRQRRELEASNKENMALLSSPSSSLLSKEEDPSTLEELLSEVEELFKLAEVSCSNRNAASMARMYHSYLTVWVSHKQYDQAWGIYEDLLEKDKAKLNMWSFKTMLQCCAEAKDLDKLSKVWQRINQTQKLTEIEDKELIILIINGFAKYYLIIIIN